MNSTTVEVSDYPDFIDQVQTLFRDNAKSRDGAGADLSPSLDYFIKQYFHQYPLEELVGRQWSDVYGCVFSWWAFLQQHDLAYPKIRVFNPNLEEHGWLSGHTVVIALQKDMPFLVDSLRVEINRRNIPIHTVKSTVLSIKRDAQNRLVEISRNQSKGSNEASEGKDIEEEGGFKKEALIFFEINLHTDENQLKGLARDLESVLNEVDAAVSAYPQMLGQGQAILQDLAAAQSQQSPQDAEEWSRAQEFLSWLMNGYFTFLGYYEMELQQKDGAEFLVENTNKRLGIKRLSKNEGIEAPLTDRHPGFASYHEPRQLIFFAKASERSRVHRSAYPDCIVLKRFDDKGRVCGEGRFLGLFTSPVYNHSPMEIPIIRDKIAYVLERSGFLPNSHDWKLLRQVLETFPRDELFQNSADDLYEVALRIAQINERHRVRLFMRRGVFGHFVSALIYVPRDLFNTEIRLKIQNILGHAVGATEQEFTTYFSESILARVHLVFKVDASRDLAWDVGALEQRIIHVIRSWEDHLFAAMLDSLGEEQGVEQFNQFRHAFPASYRESYDARTAVNDVAVVRGLSEERDIALSFYQPMGAAERSVRFKIFRIGKPIELSDVIPLLEHLGLRVIGEQPFRIQWRVESKIHTVWLHDFELLYDLPVVIDVQAARIHFQEAFEAIWYGRADSDDFNRLVLGARLNWREVALLRGYAAYMKQTAFNFSQSSIATTLAQHLEITRNLVALFKATFDPRLNPQSQPESERGERLKRKILEGLESVDNLNEDRILRRYLDLINGTLRTNFFQTDEEGAPTPYISIKFAPRTIADIPEPRPLYEVFVFSPRVEGVHLRAGRVARGGLRWSDRHEDFRTEVLGLVKAQQVKNSVIVPGGAKGGFVAKQIPLNASREETQAEGIECYKTFVRGLLDITDNLIENQLTTPPKVVRLDGDDPYLVVAADKGTATFSDIANGISREYNFWLGDAFASGGSQGYDHKRMGITARGAWVSVQRHFREQGIDVQSENIRVIGIGDMGGDVFGNGMLMSKHICLVAAFNHQHIFIDPTPDPLTSFAERERLFQQPKSSWADYKAELISEGGGIFSRSAKAIVLTPQIQALLDTKESRVTPTALIHLLLQAPVDLIWNGGIGTYVKAEAESHGEVGDKANDSLRVNGNQLRCKVFAEGGNLGMTQRGRVEYSLNGGACNTDFIDNSAGVDCSDHEVNIKILLNELVLNGDLTEKQRNQLLAEMTESVAELVLQNNYRQTQAISIVESQAAQRMGEYRRFINAMESEGRLVRALEYLPSDEALVERQTSGQALTRPELSVLISYAKVMLKESLAESDLSNNEYLVRNLESAFPSLLVERFKPALYQHRLRREIIATQLANNMVNNMGATFYQRLAESTGANPAQVAKAYVAARDIYQLEEFIAKVEALDYKIPAELQLALMHTMIRRVRRATRWLLRNRRGSLDPQKEIQQFAPVIQKITAALPDMLRGDAREEWDEEYNRLVDLGLPNKLAANVAMPNSLYSGLGMVEAARLSETDAVSAAEAFYVLGDKINLHWFAKQIVETKVESFWQAMAREAFMDDLEAQIRILAVALIRLSKGRNIDDTVDRWMEQQSSLVGRWRSMVAELQAAPGTDFAMFSVALRELLDLAQATQHSQALPEQESGNDFQLLAGG